MKASVLELCAGAGGQALGFEQAGFEHAALIDNDRHACATLRMNRPYWNVVEADLTRMSADYWQGVDVVAAGLPCPPFSIAGKQLGVDDDRDLFPALLRVVTATKPRVAMVENVRGLMQSRFVGYRADLGTTLGELGYCVSWRVFDAHDFGAAQHRTRTFMIAALKGLRFDWPQPTHDGVTVGEALHGYMAEDGWERADDWAGRATQAAPTLVGGSRKHGGPDLGPTRAREAWAALGVDGLGIADTPPPCELRRKATAHSTDGCAASILPGGMEVGRWQDAKLPAGGQCTHG